MPIYDPSIATKAKPPKENIAKANEPSQTYANVVVTNPPQSNTRTTTNVHHVQSYHYAKNEMSNVQNNDFNEVGKHNKPLHNTSRTNRTSGPIFGTKQSKKTIAGLRIVRELDIFVGGVSNDISEQGMADYMKEEIDVEPLSVELNRENEYNRSFKVTIKSVQKRQVFNADAWDSNIIVKPFRKKRSNNIESFNNFQNEFNPPNHRFQSRWDLQ